MESDIFKRDGGVKGRDGVRCGWMRSTAGEMEVTVVWADSGSVMCDVCLRIGREKHCHLGCQGCVKCGPCRTSSGS